MRNIARRPACLPACPLPVVQKTNGEDGSLPFLRLTRATANEVAAWEAEQRQQRIDNIHKAAGDGGARR